MTRVVRTRYESGVSKPLEKPDLEEGKETVIQTERMSREDILTIVRRYRDEYGVEVPKEAIKEFMSGRR